MRTRTWTWKGLMMRPPIRTPPCQSMLLLLLRSLAKKSMLTQSQQRIRSKTKKTKQLETVQTKADTNKPPKVPHKLKHLAGILETQQTELQWIIVENFEAMLGPNEKLLRKVDSFPDKKSKPNTMIRLTWTQKTSPKRKHLSTAA